jgi:DNA-directed RNA polymerase specialized sigma24 family protein
MLYDEHAEALYAYCHIMVGDEAADAVRDAFIAAARHRGTTPSHEAALPVWLCALARAECVRRGALVRKASAPPSADPLRRALTRLRPEHREALALSVILGTPDLARVVGVAADTADMLVRVSRRRLDEAAASVLGTVRDEAMLGALSEGHLPMLVMRGHTPPPRQRERVLSSCAAAERAADGALLFDQDGMPIQLDALFGNADDVTHPFAQVPADVPSSGWIAEPTAPPEPVTGPLRQVGPVPSRRHPRVTHARPKEPFLSRRRDSLVEVAGLAACVAAAASVLALWPSPHDPGTSNVDGTSLLVHRGVPASRSAQPVPSRGGGALPPQAAAPKPSASPSAKKPDAAATTAPPVAAPAPPPETGPVPAHPTPTPTESSPTTTPTPTPTPSGTPTDTPTPEPSAS